MNETKHLWKINIDHEEKYFTTPEYNIQQALALYLSHFDNPTTPCYVDSIQFVRSLPSLAEPEVESEPVEEE